MKHLIGLAVGLLLAVFDLINMTIVKSHFLGVLKPIAWMVIPTVLYALEPWIFLKGLNFANMTVLNLSWDLMSDILVTLVGIFYFKEQISGLKYWGVLFAFISIILFGMDDSAN